MDNTINDVNELMLCLTWQSSFFFEKVFQKGLGLSGIIIIIILLSIFMIDLEVDNVGFIVTHGIYLSIKNIGSSKDSHREDPGILHRTIVYETRM